MINPKVFETLFEKGAGYLDIETLGIDPTSPIHEVSYLGSGGGYEYLPSRARSFAPKDNGFASRDVWRLLKNKNDITLIDQSWPEALTSYSNEFTNSKATPTGVWKHLVDRNISPTRTASIGQGVSSLVETHTSGDLSYHLTKMLELNKDKVLWIANSSFESKHLGLAMSMEAAEGRPGIEVINNMLRSSTHQANSTLLVADPGILKARGIAERTNDWRGVWTAIKNIDTSKPGIQVLDVLDVVKAAQSHAHFAGQQLGLGINLSNVARGSSLGVQSRILGFGEEFHRGIEDNLLAREVAKRTATHSEVLENLTQRAMKSTASLNLDAQEMDALRWAYKMHHVKNFSNDIYAKSQLARAHIARLEAQKAGTQFKHVVSSGYINTFINRTEDGIDKKIAVSNSNYLTLDNMNDVKTHFANQSINEGVDIEKLDNQLMSELNGKSLDEQLSILDRIKNSTGKQVDELAANISDESIDKAIVADISRFNGKFAKATDPINPIKGLTAEKSIFRTSMKMGAIVGGAILGATFLKKVVFDSFSAAANDLPSKTKEDYNSIEGMQEGGLNAESRHLNTDFGSGWRNKRLNKYKKIFFKGAVKHGEEPSFNRTMAYREKLAKYDFNNQEHYDWRTRNYFSGDALSSGEGPQKFYEEKAFFEEQENLLNLKVRKEGLRNKLKRKKVNKINSSSAIKTEAKSTLPTSEEAINSYNKFIKENVVDDAARMASKPLGTETKATSHMGKWGLGLGIAAIALGGIAAIAFSSGQTKKNQINGLSEQGVASQTRKSQSDFGSPYRGLWDSVSLKIAASNTGMAFLNQSAPIDQRITDYRMQMQTPLQKRAIEAEMYKQELKSYSSTYYLDPSLTTPVASTQYSKWGLNPNKKGLQVMDLNTLSWAVEDADTIIVKTMADRFTGQQMSIRLAGIDAPEVSHGDETINDLRINQNQPHGEESAQRLREILQNSKDLKVVIDPHNETYGRTLGVIVADGQNVASKLVSEGQVGALAFGDVKEDLISRSKLATQERDAFQDHRGMWKDEFWRTYREAMPSNYRITNNTLTRLDKLSSDMTLGGLFSIMNLKEEGSMSDITHDNLRYVKGKLEARMQEKTYSNVPYNLNYSGRINLGIDKIKMNIDDDMKNYGQLINKELKVDQHSKYNKAILIDSLDKSTSVYHAKKEYFIKKHEADARLRKKYQGSMQRQSNKYTGIEQ